MRVSAWVFKKLKRYLLELDLIIGLFIILMFQAIENTIGGQTKDMSIRPKTAVKPKKLSKTDADRRAARKLLGELFIDKEYLEKLLNHPDLVKADTKTENVSDLAKDAINFLNNRQEFWRQQKKCSSNFSDKKLLEGELPEWL